MLGCQPEHSEGPKAPFQKVSTVGFAEIKTQILEPHCISCHEKRHSAFQNYSTVKIAANKILRRVSSTDPQRIMPPPPEASLPREKLSLLREWIEAGLPEFPTGTGKEEKPIQMVYFDEVKRDLLTPRCIGCHSQYNNYFVVRENLTSIYSFVLEKKMPFPRKKNQPVLPLKKAQLETLKNWIDGGALYSKELPEPKDLGNELVPTWVSLRDKVIGPKCILCHNSFGSRAPTAMETHLQLRKWWGRYPELFNVKEPEKSHFIGAILGRVNEETGEFFYDKMPFNSPTDDVERDVPDVTEKELEVIKEWISKGLPYDREDRGV